jgi:hypothetical protein
VDDRRRATGDFRQRLIVQEYVSLTPSQWFFGRNQHRSTVTNVEIVACDSELRDA